MKKYYIKKFIQVLSLQIIIVLFALTSNCLGETLFKVKVKPFSLVKNKKVKLGDIAQLTGNKPELVRSAKSIVLTSAPPFGKSIFIGKSLIKGALMRQGFDLKKIKLIFPNKIMVKNKLTIISKDEVKESIRDYIYKNMPWDKNQVKISEIDFNGKILLPNGEITQKITSKKYSSFIGELPLFLEFKVDGRSHRRQKIKVKIDVLIPAVLTRGPMKRNQIISEKDIYVENKWVSNKSQKMITSIADVIGKRLKKNLKTGEPLFESLLEIPSTIKKGKRVLILVETKNVRITIPGIAVEAGKKGQIIKVKNVDSNKVVYARVMDNSTVKIDL